MSVIGAVVFAVGVGVVWFGVLDGVGGPLPGLRRARTRFARLVMQVGVPALAAAAVCGFVAWEALRLPALAVLAACAGGYAPLLLRRGRVDRRRREREQAWPAALDQLADGFEAGLAFPAAAAFVAQSGPSPLRSDFARLYRSVREGALDAGLDELFETGERAGRSAAALLRAALLDVPTGGVAPVLRELAGVLRERWETRERARSRALSLRREAAILAVSPLAFVLLIGASAPGYLDAYRTASGTAVSLLGTVVILGCYLAMRRLGRVPDPGDAGSSR